VAQTGLVEKKGHTLTFLDPQFSLGLMASALIIGLGILVSK